MEELQLQLLHARIRSLALGDFGDQPLVRIRQFGSPLADSLLEHFGQMQQLGFRPLLCGQVAADRGGIHRASAARLVDAEPIDQERDLGAGFKVTESDLADPASFAHDNRPDLVAHARALLRSNEVQEMEAGGMFHPGQADKSQSGGIDILRTAVQAGEADEVGRTFDQACEPMLLRLHMPPLGDQFANASSQFVGIRKLLDPWHDDSPCPALRPTLVIEGWHVEPAIRAT